MFDVTRKKTFWELEAIVEAFLVEINQKHEDFPILIIGNKVDCPDTDRVVSREMANVFCSKYGFLYMECSAKNDVNVDQVCME